MEYFNLLEFKKEPFSNSPEPEFLFAAPQHNTCLQRLELAVRLRRGLNIVIGAVGTGKTTLCRKLIQNLSIPVASEAPAVETFLLLDPAVAGRLDFIKTVASILGISDVSATDNEWHIKEKIKNFLFEQGVQEQKNIVLVIDEGQKIPDDCLEILREFLNYETNSFKLLQIVIFAQPEFRKSLAARANLLDRVNYLYYLKPLSFLQTKAMIEYRISLASVEPDRRPLFTFGGMLAVYLATMGYPRKVVSLCHQVLLMMMIRGKNKAGWFLVRSCIGKTAGHRFRRAAWATLGLLTLAALAVSAVLYWTGLPNIGSRTQYQRVLSGIDIHKESLTPLSARPDRREAPKQIDSVKNPLQPDVSQVPIQKGSVEISEPAQSSDVHEKIHDYLGTIVIKRGMTVWQVLGTIYGSNGQEITQKFLEANPQIKNRDYIVPGTMIQLPATPGSARPLKTETILVSLEKSKNLENIYYSFVEKKEMNNMPAMLLVPLWNKREGRQFAIVLDKSFTSTEEAGEAVRRLPLALATSAQVLSQWDSDTVLFNTRLSGN
ncbi:MAG: ExeA family protein [Smithellaceae bacterium]